MSAVTCRIRNAQLFRRPLEAAIEVATVNSGEKELPGRDPATQEAPENANGEN